MTGQVAERRFGPAFVEDMRQRYGRRPASQRQLTYDIAVDDEFEPWRLWLDEQLALLPNPEASDITRSLWLDEHFWPKVFELATGAALRERGLDIAYERAWDGQTPDWTILTSSGNPACFVEVHTDQPPRQTFGAIRAWHELEERIAAIPAPYILYLEPHGPPRTPDPRTSKRIAQDLRRKLLRLEPDRRLFSEGYYFRLATDRFGNLQRSPNGIRAQLATPSSIAGQITARDLANGALRKVSKYRKLAAKHDVPLVVALGAHRFTGVNLSDLDALLNGESIIRMQFNPGDTYIGEATATLGEPDKWAMPPELSGILWISNEFPFPASSRPNHAALRAIPQVLKDV